jgi:outer membrane immunogenic protein
LFRPIRCPAGGWFIGAGDEYALNFLPGLFWKTEYRYSEFDRSDVTVVTFPGGLNTGVNETQKFREHSVRSELVYRFNWGGAGVVAKY